jgi:hypothetical protein
MRCTFVAAVAALVALTPATLAAQSRFIVGVCTHFSQGKGILDANLAVIRQSGAISIRDEVAWGAVEREKGQYSMPQAFDDYVNRALHAGLQPLLILDYGNRFYDDHDKPTSPEAIEAFTRYAEFIVRHFKGKVRMYEVWNEWDIAIGGTTAGSAETYAQLLKAVYPRIKKIDPAITVLAGCPTSGGIRKGWLDRMLAANVLDSLDAVSIHTYNYSGQGRARTPAAWADFVAAAEDAIHRHSGGRDVPLHVTEMGWPTHTGPRGTSPEQSAAYLAQTFLLARTMPYLKGLWWYDFQDDGWKPDHNENNFGLVRPDLTPKPSYHALRSISAIVAGAEFVAKLDAGLPDVVALKFRTPNSKNDGKDLIALWTETAEERRIVLSTTNTARKPVQLIEAGRAPVERPWGFRDWAATPRAPLDPDRMGVVIRETPVLITGDALAIAHD